jgi:hypothetical protein
MMSRSTLAAAAALVCLTPAGCGGDNGRAKAAFVREADTICGKANQLVRALGPEPPILTDRQADWILALTEIDRNALKNLRALEPPKHERPMVASMISLFERRPLRLSCLVGPGGGRAATTIRLIAPPAAARGRAASAATSSRPRR